jgi:hypothetical protein
VLLVLDLHTSGLLRRKKGWRDLISCL